MQQEVEISPDVLCQEMAGETVILDLKSETYFGLDAVGTRIWQTISQTGNLRQAFTEVLGEYDVEELQLEKDFSELMNSLSEAGLVSLKPKSL